MISRLRVKNKTVDEEVIISKFNRINRGRERHAPGRAWQTLR